jgi:hypothetical protein
MILRADRLVEMNGSRAVFAHDVYLIECQRASCRIQCEDYEAGRDAVTPVMAPIA